MGDTSRHTVTPAYERWALGILGILALCRLLYLAFVPLELVGDESYYWMWGQNLDWGYLSKPPLIGWLMALGSWIGQGSAWGIRALAVLLGTGSLLFTYLLARETFGTRAAWLCLLAVALSPANAVLNLLLTIDAPLVFFWSAALYCFWKAVHSEGDSRRGWAIALLLVLGFGFLAKQMMLVFLVFGLIFLLTDAEKRALLSKPALWLLVAISLLFLLPPVLWNAHHEWVTLSHTGHHFQGDDMNLPDFIGRLAGFLGSQAGLLGPIVWGLLVFTLWQGFRHFRKLERKERFLLLFGGPGLIVVLLMTIRQDINPNWPAVFYVSPLILTAGWTITVSERFRLPSERWLLRGIKLGAVLMCVLYVIPFAIPAMGLKGSKIDATARLSGWKELASRVEPYRMGDTEIILAVGHRYTASELSFYLQGQPDVRLWEPVLNTQFGIWGMPDACADCPVLIVSAEEDPLPPDLAVGLISPEKVADIVIPMGERTRHYQVFQAKGWEGVDYP